MSRGRERQTHPLGPLQPVRRSSTGSRPKLTPMGRSTPRNEPARAESARKAYFTRLALRSSVSRRRAVEARSAVEQFEHDADDADAELAFTGTDDTESSS